PAAFTVTLTHQSAGLLTIPATIAVPANATNVPFVVTVGQPTIHTTVSITSTGSGASSTRQYVVRP
ncbi:MAG: hypothetical protein AB1762_16125, partial [Gemmatimonadota bacterium]